MLNNLGIKALGRMSSPISKEHPKSIGWITKSHHSVTDKHQETTRRGHLHVTMMALRRTEKKSWFEALDT